MAQNRASIYIDINMSVSNQTAETALRLVEIYVNSTNHDVAVDKNEDGTLSFKYIGG